VKISNKISSFLLFLLIVLCFNTMMGLTQLSKIGKELNAVVKQDIALTEFIMSIEKHQFQKVILFERVVRVGEELVFEEMSESRRRYLLDYLGGINEGFYVLKDLVFKDIENGYKIIKEEINSIKLKKDKENWESALSLLQKVEEEHNEYCIVNERFFDLVSTGTHQISFDDIKRIRRAEKFLNKKLEDLIDKVKGFALRSLHRAQREEALARKVLWVSFIISFFISVILAYGIIRSILRPLKILVNAANQIGRGDFVVNLEDASRDEIGEVSRAINAMAAKLSEVNAELEHKNKSLSESLEVTHQQKLALEKVNKELDRFVHTVSHDIKAPLTGIIGYGNYLDKQYGSSFDPKGKRSIDGIKRGAERLNQLIQDLLALTRISRVKNPYERVDARELVLSIEERLEYSISQFHVVLDIDCNLPMIVCDRIKLSEVFLNLMSNAIKFSSKGQEAPKIQVGYKVGRDTHEFFVKDNGIGILKEDQPKVFMMFQRLNHDQDYEGTGAGLAIVKEIITDHGGKIWIESQPGEGTTFYFSIPKNLKIAGDEETTE